MKTSSKRIISILLMICMMIGSLPTIALAEEPKSPVTSIEITNVPTPVAGLPCSTKAITITTNPQYASEGSNIFWYDDTVGKRAATFIEGHEYHICIEIEMGAYVTVDFDTTTSAMYAPYTGEVTINGGAAAIAEELPGSDKGLFIAGKNVVAKALKPIPSVSVNLYAYNKIKATWPKLPDVAGYKIMIKEDGKKNYVLVDQNTRTSIVISNLTAGKKYNVAITPYLGPYGDQSGPLSYATTKISSAIYTLKQLNTPKVKKKSSRKIVVKWNNISGESGYQISKSTKRTKTGTIYTVKTTTGKSKTLTVKRKKKYYYKVRAYKNVDGKKIYGPWSAVKSFKLK